MECCGAPIFWFRTIQCVHQWEDQQRTAWAVRSQAMLMQRAERAVPAEQMPAATLWELAA